MATTVRYVRPRPNREGETIFLQLLLALAGGVVLFLAVVFILTTGYRVLYAGRIFPGVSIAGVDVSGLKPDDAVLQLSSGLTYPYSGRIVFRDGDKIWTTTPTQLGMVFDPGSTTQVAFNFGRSFNIFTSINDQLNSAQVGVDLPPITTYDQRLAYNYLQNLAREIDRPAVEATLVINGLDVVAQPGQVGRRLNVDATLVFLNAQLQTFRDGEVPLVIQDQQPEILDVSAQAELARRVLSAPFALVLPDAKPGDPGPWFIEPQELAQMLQVSRVRTDSGEAVYRLELDPQKLSAKLTGLAPQIDQPEENARFTFNDQTGQLDLIQSAKIGRVMDISRTIQAVENSVALGYQSAALELNITEPQVTDSATSQSLNITQLISSQTTYFYGSSTSRMQNIQTAAAKFHGLLVAPGETFSMGNALGDVSLDSGYAEALIIYGGRTIKGVGGGVCQVSTTLFRTAFFAGFPVVERYAHAYRVYYYEMRQGGGYDPNMAGFDATVYFPVVDFKFVNDSPYWLLMETYFNPQSYSLTWKFYSTSDGRSVTYTNSGPLNVVPAPDPVIQFNADFQEGEFRQTDYAAEGADVTIERTVMRDAKILFVDKFVTHYEPWRAVCEYGPGVDDPEKIAKRRGLCQ
jgi:vancomycin resistance protein YoaR